MVCLRHLSITQYTYSMASKVTHRQYVRRHIRVLALNFQNSYIITLHAVLDQLIRWVVRYSGDHRSCNGLELLLLA